VRTVERHVENLYGKIGVSGRTARAAATAWAIGNGLV
jgi:DNA-binding NarL/FixJ family response regulator